MSPSTDTRDQLRAQAHDLYWNSPDTVDQLADRLGMSRKSLYASVRPIPVGTACLHCGGPLVFTNRSRRTSRSASCPACGSEVTLGEASVSAAASAAPVGLMGDGEGVEVHAVPEPQSRWEQIKEDLAAVPPDRAAKIGGVAALGVALGAAAVKAIKKRT